jgi:hypothetical protein
VFSLNSHLSSLLCGLVMVLGLLQIDFTCLEGVRFYMEDNIIPFQVSSQSHSDVHIHSIFISSSAVTCVH